MGHAHAHAVAEAAELKGFGKPDEVREFPRGRVELINIGGATIGRAIFEPGWRWATSVQPLVKIGGATIGRAIFEPGWRWATSVQPIAKTRSCEAPHFQYHVAGVLRIRMDNGEEFDCKPGDLSLLPSGHDAWVVGNEAAVVVDFQGMIDYAKGAG